MKYDLNRLNCMNYQVDYTEDGYSEYYYLVDGLRSLYRFAKTQNIPFKELCISLLNNEQVTLSDLESTTITMI